MFWFLWLRLVAQNQQAVLDSSSLVDCSGCVLIRSWRSPLFSMCLSYHQLRTARDVKINSWWGLLLSYQISVWRREATSESWGVLCSSQSEFFPRLTLTLKAHAASHFKGRLDETQMHIQQWLFNCDKRVIWGQNGNTRWFIGLNVKQIFWLISFKD